MINLNDYDYELPESLIAAYPVEKRDHSKLLVTNKGSFNKNIIPFYDIIEHLDNSIHLVFNDAKVLKARLFGKKKSGGVVEIFLNRLINSENNEWEIIGRKIAKLNTGDIIYFEDGLEGILSEGTNERVIKFNLKFNDFDNWILKHGRLPLPPYILKSRESKSDENIDNERYQTVYASTQGAVAAPTAGLHFTNELLDKIAKKGITVSFLTLYVGLGTFLPVKSDTIEKHKMHSEFYVISEKTAQEINSAKDAGKKIVAVGTTSLRALEANGLESGKVIPKGEDTEIFIYPGYKFKVIDGLITNFHLPKSTLMLLVSALHGAENIKDAYQYAIDNTLRFYSYGDAMFIKPI